MKTLEELKAEYAQHISDLRGLSESEVQSYSKTEMLTRLHVFVGDMNAHLLATVELLKKKGIFTEREFLEALISQLEI
ncbi:MAG TPA: hypothetical protein VOA88_11050 [Candidatus Dormibacteraeota bacterium]|nr:hypothetical protein [Candidatus Dormibacteraeota bacterium]